MALSVATGTFPITGANITISGLAFQPKIVLFWVVAGANGANGTFGSPITTDGVAPAPSLSMFGAYDGTNQWCNAAGMCNNYTANGLSGAFSGLLATRVLLSCAFSGSSFDATSSYSAFSMNSDGFTLQPVSVGGPSPNVGDYQVHYLALGGTDLVNAVVGQVTLPASTTSNQSVTGLGFQPTCLIGSTCGRSANNANPNFLNADWSVSLGVCDASLNQGVVANWQYSDGANGRTAYYNQSGEFYAASKNGDTTGPNVLNNHGLIASLDSGGFTVTPSLSASADLVLSYIALEVTDSLVGSFSTATNTTAFSQTGQAFRPAAVLFASSCQLANTANTLAPTATMSIGAAIEGVSIGQNVAARTSTDNAAINIENGGEYFDSVYLNLAVSATPITNPTVQGAMKVNTLNGDGFTTQMTVADVQANPIIFLSLGPGIASGVQVSGTILDGSSNPVVGATVACTGQTSATTASDGTYSFAAVPPGSVTITPTLTGWTFSPTSTPETVGGSPISGVNFTGTHLAVTSASFSPAGGTYQKTQTVTLANADSALTGFAMHYTTDGSTPTTGSATYSVPLSITLPTVLKVLSVATGYTNSPVVTATYTFGAGGFSSDFSFAF